MSVRSADPTGVQRDVRPAGPDVRKRQADPAYLPGSACYAALPDRLEDL